MKIEGKNYRTIWFDKETSEVNIIDQTKLPHKFVIKKINNFDDAFNAIKKMEVRGAPLIGAMAAYGISLAVKNNPSDEALKQASAQLINSRPTAINLRWAVDIMNAELKDLPENERYPASIKKSQSICDDDVVYCKKIGEFGNKIITDFLKSANKKEVNILTHCNAGWLATIDWGTATSPIYHASKEGIKIHVWVDETRPRNQGSSLTAWELGNEGIDYTIVVDNAGGHLMQKGLVDVVITGSDRTTSKGDVCNKIGTYLKALAARENEVPFYVGLPSSTIDWEISDGTKDIPIELRDSTEVTTIYGKDEQGEMKKIFLAPDGAKAANYAFDVTPSSLVTGLITERGVCEASSSGLLKLFPEQKKS